MAIAGTKYSNSCNANAEGIHSDRRKTEEGIEQLDITYLTGIEDNGIAATMPTSGLPPGQMRRSGRTRAPTAKARQREQEEAATYGEYWEGDESDAMEGVLMATGDPVGSTTDANEYTAEPPLTANIEMTGTDPLARPAVTKD